MIVVSEQEISIVSFLQELKNMKRMYILINLGYDKKLGKYVRSDLSS